MKLDLDLKNKITHYMEDHKYKVLASGTSLINLNLGKLNHGGNIKNMEFDISLKSKSSNKEKDAKVFIKDCNMVFRIEDEKLYFVKLFAYSNSFYDEMVAPNDKKEVDFKVKIKKIEDVGEILQEVDKVIQKQNKLLYKQHNKAPAKSSITV